MFPVTNAEAEEFIVFSQRLSVMDDLEEGVGLARAFHYNYMWAGQPGWILNDCTA